ncbi:DUF2460 domain-containing protein [Hephaestia sp. GCM10023244]|uniref:DUF2460 domain-containing protein n=1 Tax=unclassified Hephaestia TaxID=2631281 RepID=UPI00207792A1|nr:DUF2460 domain-containing protein [Hephaestia sp. MAHUQ-44]MCM8729707.1 DUF2460 domain-containing protein [Hephaestia sp. MAHUQ-44]
MGYWLAQQRTVQAESVISRFDPRFWTVNFPRPMMASVVTTAPDALRVDAVFYRKSDLAGLIWEAEDTIDHPLLAYRTVRDFRDCILSFRWRSSGVQALSAINGPTLTIEGRDQSGTPRSWFVRLWNYAIGTLSDARVTLDFAQLAGGFTLPDESDPVWAGDIDRMFISLVAPAYAEGDDALLDTATEGWCEMSEIACSGAGSVLAIGDVIVPEHSLRIASGYDDSYHLTPARLLRNAFQLGYRGLIDHYVGMSHYFRLQRNGSGLYVSLDDGVLNVACTAWHRDFAQRARGLGYDVIWSLSYEVFDAHCWNDWKQRAWDASPALTGWEPPSTLLSPAHAGAMAYLQQVAVAFVSLARESGMPAKFQVGEPWWWVMPDGRPCLYDDAAKAALGGAPVEIASVRGALDETQTALLDAAGALLAQSTAALIDALVAAFTDVETYLLAYLPSVLDPAAPEIRRANLPTDWAAPAFDVLQLEDYDWVTDDNSGASARARAEATARLGYPERDQHYLSGFVLNAEDADQWRAIDAAAERARGRVAETFVWALPQVMRDGFIHFDEEAEVQAFDDVLFPIALGREAEVAPGFATAIVTSAGGHERRNASWAEARTRYDVGPGVRSEEDIATLLGFFRARMGPARGFRLRDPFDGNSGAGSAIDQQIAIGDGAATRFALVKHYGPQVRRITRPVAGSVRIAVDGEERTDFAIEPGGWIALDEAPAMGAVLTAGFAFDVPVRFAEDQLSVTRATFLAGEAPSVPLVELREA